MALVTNEQKVEQLFYFYKSVSMLCTKEQLAVTMANRATVAVITFAAVFASVSQVTNFFTISFY